MNTNVNNTIERLNEILPLAKRQHSPSEEMADVYQQILYSYVDCSKTLNRNEFTQQVKNRDNREIFNLPGAIDFAAAFFVPHMTKQAA